MLISKLPRMNVKLWLTNSSRWGAFGHSPRWKTKLARNAGFIRQKAALLSVLPDKSGVPGAGSGCIPHGVALR
jgi:hypothetical protein